MNKENRAIKEVRMRRTFDFPSQQVSLVCCPIRVGREYMYIYAKKHRASIKPTTYIRHPLYTKGTITKAIYNTNPFITRTNPKSESHLLLPRRPSTGPRARAWPWSRSSSKKVPFKHIEIGILTPIMLKVHRHTKTKVNSNAVSSAVAQRRHVQHAVVNIPLGIHRYSALCAGRVEVEEIEAESRGTLLLHRVERMMASACRSAAWRGGVLGRVTVVVLMLLLLLLLGGHGVVVLVVFHRGSSLHVRTGAIRRETRAGLLRVIGSNGVRLRHSATSAGLFGDRAFFIEDLTRIHIEPWHGSGLASLGLSAWVSLLVILS